MKRELNELHRATSEQRTETCALLIRIDGLENSSRCSNLLIYNVPDVDDESPQISEKKTLDFARENLGINVDNSHVERARRFGAFGHGKTRPNIVKSSSLNKK